MFTSKCAIIVESRTKYLLLSTGESSLWGTWMQNSPSHHVDST